MIHDINALPPSMCILLWGCLIAAPVVMLIITALAFKDGPENWLKDVLRAVWYNCRNARFKFHRLGPMNFLCEGDGVQWEVYNVPSFEVGNDLIALRGYMSRYNLKSGDRVLDAGASSGVATLYFSKMVGDKGKVMALEPDKASFKKLIQNCKSANVRNVTCWQWALMDKSGKVNFNSGNGQSSNVQNNGNTSIPCMTINDCGRVDFVKMDIEGAEIEAMLGFDFGQKPVFAIASYHIRDGKKTCGWLEDFFRRKGYKTITSHNIHLTTHAFYC